ncbi:alpha-crystallin A chain-like [Glandiceps talaboti]
MSMIPFSHPFFEDFDFTSHLFDEAHHHHGLSSFFEPHSLYGGYYITPRRQRFRPRLAQRQAFQSEDTQDRFRVMLDVHHFQPDEVTLKLVDNRIVVCAKHEEKQDEHGYISREFTRQYIVPNGTDLQQIKSRLSQDGILTIEAPKLSVEPPKERVIPIERGEPSNDYKMEGQKKEEEEKAK